MYQSIITSTLEENLDSLMATTTTGFCNVRQDGLPLLSNNH